jgi:chaperonin cofactor prefoldin
MTQVEELENMIATLELENKLMRARNERLEKEIEELHNILIARVKNENS